MKSPEGVKIFRTEIVATDMIMLDKRPVGEEDDFIPSEGSVEVNENTFNPDEGFGDPVNEVEKPKEEEK